jgi:hypothetical protein
MIFVMVRCCVFFAVRTKLLNITEMNFGFKGNEFLTDPIFSWTASKIAQTTVIWMASVFVVGMFLQWIVQVNYVFPFLHVRLSIILGWR